MVTDPGPAPFRAEQRRESHRKILRQAFLLALAFHVAGAVAIHPSFFRDLFGRRVMIGFPGQPHPGELAPQGEPWEKEISLVRARHLTGPITLFNAEVVGAQAQETSPQSQGTPVPAPAISTDPPGERHGSRGSPLGTSTGAVVLELSEDWILVPGSTDVARSDQFQTLKIVRPEYPDGAIRAGIEGLIKLSVQVDAAGKVRDVKVLESAPRGRILANAAMEAMLLWEFKPYQLRGTPIPFTVIVPFRFRLVD